MCSSDLVRAFFGVTIAALGGVLLLKNLEIVKFDSWHLFWGTVWAVGLVLAGTNDDNQLPEDVNASVGFAIDGYWRVDWFELLRRD